MTTCQNNICQTKPANDDWPDRTPDKTTPAKAGVSSSELTTSSPCNTTCQNPNQTTPAHHQSTRRDHNTPANDDAPHEEMDHTPAVAGYRLNHPQNESPKPNAPRNTPRRNPGTRTHDTRPQGPQMNHTCFGGCVIILRPNPREHHTPAEVVCHLDPTPATPLNEHRRMTTHPLNESRKRQQVETMTQALDEPHTRRSGCGILLNPHPPTEAMTPPNENMQPQVRGAPMVKCAKRRPQYHTPAQAGVR
ncbi:hypothetical protein BS47DRAFT_1365935 [Hydnum rufescens UP504]|uniref:Uncharacterized protein n=1 Tax=Hydnum rufescens UP504 TaxID=1448309 RepID=A0A9P6AND7_9AGAM|nr:hypothetical protein BS47DRAFT_1365935 [Hydnum rufescens UP504]